MPAGTIVLPPLVGVTEKAVSEQIAAGVTLAITGFGFTLITTVKAVPEQLLKTGVIVYVAVCTVLVGLINVPPIVVRLVPLAPPVIPPVTTGALQE